MTGPDNTPRKELQEKDFIQDSLQKNPFPFWIWLFILTALVAIFWGSSDWYSNFINKEIAQSPFLQVTNRQFSVFLWQFPEYMRINASSKRGYLTGFEYEEKVSIVPGEADNFVVAPPDLIFLYHTWHRQISTEFTKRPIPSNEFKEFLTYSEEWQPNKWPTAPVSYAALVQTLAKSTEVQDLNELPEAELPMDVREAFQGWKNYTKEGVEINSINPSYEELDQFLKAHPHYARNYWRNILIKNYPKYLISAGKTEKGIIPKDEIAPFLRVAIFNFLQAQKKK